MGNKNSFEIIKNTSDTYIFDIEVPIIDGNKTKRYHGAIKFKDGKFKECSYDIHATYTLTDWDFIRQLAELIDELASKYI